MEEGEIKDVKEEKNTQKVPLSLEEILEKKKEAEKLQSKVSGKTY